MSEPLFYIEPPAPHGQACTRCGLMVLALRDELRVSGWQVYDGTSWTGQPLHVRICPTCQKCAKDERTAEPRQHPQQEPLFRWTAPRVA